MNNFKTSNFYLFLSTTVLLLTAALFTGLPLNSYALKGEKHDGHEHVAGMMRTKDGKVIVKVKGMVCAFCAQGIEKNFKGREEVKATKVDLDKMQVAITLKKGKNLKEEIIEKLITDAGFNYVGVVGKGSKKSTEKEKKKGT